MRRRATPIVIGLLAALALAPGCASGIAREPPLVIAHRGASQYLPEHTMEAYRLAISQGADFIEPDLLLTADGVPVARHDRSLAQTTDIAAHPGLPVELDRLRFAELRQLRAVSRGGPAYSPPGAAPPGLRVPAFAEILDELRLLHATTGRIVGVYPEVKTIGDGLNPYNRALADAMLAELAHPRHGGLFDGSRGNVFLQSFDAEVVAYLARASALPVIQLAMRCPDRSEIAAIVARADGVGIPAATAGVECLQRLRAGGLIVHVWTLSNADPGLHATMYARGVDGVFSNAPDTAVAQRAQTLPGAAPRTWVATPRRRGM
jgi:glycerophosphoryl diester phosphodiesterase